MMVFDILTTFPNSFAPLQESIVKRAQNKGLVQVNIHDLRKWTTDKHHTTDDRPFGGFPGMLMKIEPIYRALKDLGVYPNRNEKTKIVLTSAKGKTWNQQMAQQYSQEIERMVIICGHYEGVDHRVEEFLVDEEISIGNYVLSGGELASMIMVDSITRLVSGVVGNSDSLIEESHVETFDKEYPQYTRPSTFVTDEGEEWSVPPVLLSGNHKEIQEWKS